MRQAFTDKKRVAIIDTGTNTFHLLIIDIENARAVNQVHKSHVAVKLAEGGLDKSIIAPQPYQRGMDAFDLFKSVCNKNGVEAVYATGTAALREAANAGEFIEDVKTRTGITINVISGDDEAELIWQGVRNALNMGTEQSLIMDIGGGSTEFIIASHDEIKWKKSYKAGAALLIEKFKPADPVTAADINALELFLSNELQDLIEAINKYQPQTLIGSSGSFDTFADVITLKNNTHHLLQNQTTYDFNLDDYKVLHSKLLHSSHAERLAMPGMLPMRADMIVVASILTNYILNISEIKNMKLSTYALKEGVMQSIISGKIMTSLFSYD